MSSGRSATVQGLIARELLLTQLMFGSVCFPRQLSFLREVWLRRDHRKFRWEPSRHSPRGPRRPLPISLEVAHQRLQIHLDMPLDVGAAYK